jgi:hypothetical protein
MANKKSRQVGKNIVTLCGGAEHTLTLNGAYYKWLEMRHPNALRFRNRDRKANDLKNYERALRCFAAGVNEGNDDLSAVAQECLIVSDFVLGRAVEQGAAWLNAHKARPASEKTIKNLIACCKAVQTVVRGSGQPAGKSLFIAMRDRPKRKYRKPFPQRLWPQSLLHDFEGYAQWKTKAILAPEEGEQLRPTVCRPVTIQAYIFRINQYVGYLMRERGLDNLTLVDLCQQGFYADFLNWYLECDAVGGYVTAQSTGTTLGTISRYLVAMGRLPQKASNGKDMWEEFYAMSGKALEVGAIRGELLEQEDIGSWKPNDLLAVGREAWNTPAPRYRRGDEECYQTRAFNRLRSGLFFLLAYETPLRARNFREMRWGTNLKKNVEGRYDLHFKGLELKVAKRGFRTNEYRHTYSEEASQYIDRWRKHLASRFGEDFETCCPYVFASSSGINRPVNTNTFRCHISALVFELRGETFNPHKVRHIVASHLVREMKGGHNLAARLLGNKKETVLSTYDRPNNDEALQEYLEKRRLGKI